MIRQEEHDRRNQKPALTSRKLRLYPIRNATSTLSTSHPTSRKKGVTDPAAYIWVSEKNVERESATLQQQGAIYRNNYGCTAVVGDYSQMIFERPTVGDGKQREYKVLPIEVKPVGNGVNEFELSSGSKNGTQELKRLTEEGFLVRDIFGCHLSEKKNRASRFKILLERVR